MIQSPTLHEVYLWMRAILQHGLRVDDAVRAYMRATFGNADLNEILRTCDSGEADVLLELIFYPDFELQLRFEREWGHIAFSEKDRQTLGEALASADILARVSNAHGTLPVEIAVPGSPAAAFVQHFNIAWQPPARIDAALQSLPEKQRLRARVHLRNTAMQWHDGRIEFACACLDKLPALDEAFESRWCYILSILSELPPKGDAYDFLISKKSHCFQALCKAEAFERRLRNSNMETLMLQGERAANGDTAGFRRTMRMIDDICRLVFGRTEFFQQPLEAGREEDHALQPHDLATIVQRLS